MPAIVILGLAAVWAQLNFLGYWATDITGMAYTFGYCSIPQFRAFQCSPVNGDSLASLVSFLVASGIFAAARTIIFWTSRSLFRRRGVTTGIALIIAAVYSAAVLGFSAFELSFSNPPGSWYVTNISPDQGARIALFIPIYLLVPDSGPRPRPFNQNLVEKEQNGPTIHAHRSLLCLRRR